MNVNANANLNAGGNITTPHVKSPGMELHAPGFHAKGKPMEGKRKLKLEWRTKIIQTGGLCSVCKSKFSNTKRPVNFLPRHKLIFYLRLPSMSARSVPQQCAAAAAKVCFVFKSYWAYYCNRCVYLDCTRMDTRP